MSIDNRTELNDCDTITGWTGQGKEAVNTDAGQRYEGTGSIEDQRSNSDEETYTTSIGGTRDLSDSTVYIMAKDNLAESFANGGIQIVLFDGTDRIGYDVGGNDAVGLPLSPFFNCFKLDVSVIVTTPGNFAVYAGSEANLAQTAITGVGIGTLHLAKAVGSIPNCWLDRLTFINNGSYALTINGGTAVTAETMADVVGDDITNGWGMVSNPVGSQFQFFAPTEWGESVASADAYFSAENEQWFWIGDNAGGHTVGATHFPFRVVGNATDTISFILNNVVIVNSGTRAQFDMSSADVDNLELTSVTFTNLGTITLQNQAIGTKFLQSCIFNNCDKVIISNLDIDDTTFNGSNDADGAILLDEDSDKTVGIAGTQSSLVFNSDGTGHAIHIRPTGAGPFEFDFDNWKFNDYANDAGTATDRVVYINPVTTTADITINILNGSDIPSIREDAGYTGTVTINNSVTVDVSGVTQGSAIKVVANETVGTITKGDTILEALADLNGQASTSFSYENAFEPSGLDVIARVRNQGFPNAAIASDGGVFTDETTAANSSVIDDMTLLPASAVAGDAYYFGDPEEFPRLRLDLSQDGVGTWTGVWEYWNGAWTPLSGVQDGTDTGSGAFQQDGVVSWTLPNDWATTTINSQGPFKYVRYRLTGVTTYTTQPLGRVCKLDVTRYLPFSQNRIITSAGLSVVASWVEDTISIF